MANMIRKKGNKKSIFICQAAEGMLKAVRYTLSGGNKPEIAEVENLALPLDADDKKVSQGLTGLLKKLSGESSQFIVSLPRSSVTSRYIKVPAQNPHEIEKIVSLQAARYLPYPSNELNSGFEIIQTDAQGYSQVNLVIAHKDAIEKYLKASKEAKARSASIILSSYGILNLYNYCVPEGKDPVIILDIDFNQAELVVAGQGKLFFSRSFKITKTNLNWEKGLVEEINKSRDAYLKEVAKEFPGKIVVLTQGTNSAGLAETLRKLSKWQVEELPFLEKIKVPQELLSKISGFEYSFASLIGLGLSEFPEYLNIIPAELKEAGKKISLRKEHLRLAISIAGVVLIFALGMIRSLENKEEYLKRMKVELNKISKESRSLEEIEKRFQILEGYSKKRLSSLDILYELHKRLPEQIFLISLVYEDGNDLIIHGQAPELNFVFDFVSTLQKSEILKSFNIKVRYATKKKTQAGEIVDFEIACLKGK